jgi:hypothetical protein
MNYVAARRRLRSRTSGIQLHISFDPPIGEYADYASFSELSLQAGTTTLPQSRFLSHFETDYHPF